MLTLCLYILRASLIGCPDPGIVNADRKFAGDLCCFFTSVSGIFTAWDYFSKLYGFFSFFVLQ